MLMGSAMRIARAPENDDGAEPDDLIDELEDEIDEGDDAEDEGDEPDLDDDADDGEDEPEPEPRKPTRGENRVAAATRAAAEAKAEAAAIRRELEAERQARNTIPPEEMQRRREAHLATLTSDQKVEFLLAEQRQQTDREIARIRFDSYDANDKAAFAALAAKTPALRALEAEVEERLAEVRKNGGNVARAQVASFILGEKALAKATRSNNSGAKRAAAGKERQTARPTGARSDVAPRRDRAAKGDSIEALEARLRGVRI